MVLKVMSCKIAVRVTPYRFNPRQLVRILLYFTLCLLVFVIANEYLSEWYGLAVWGIQVITFQYRHINPVIITRKRVETGRGILSQEQTFKILYWTSEWGGKSWFAETGNLAKSCLYQNCITTNNKEEYDTSDIVLISMSFIHRELMVPTHKYTNQQWIMHTYESPPTDRVWNNLKNFNGLFNATWTYHSRSELRIFYGPDIIKRSRPAVDYLKINFAHGKTKLVAWFVTKCQSPLGKHSKRMQYVRNLENHMVVDIYGPCGRYKCGKTVHLSRVSNLSPCDEMLKRDYKFYLAFENSICEDYVTEKLWRALRMGVVPIVLGGANYKELLPAHSYIDIADFSSPKHLADYLYILDENEALYNGYFRWKVDYTFKQDDSPDICKICEYVNNTWNQTQVYENMAEFWSEKNMCTAPEVYYKDVQQAAWHWQSPKKTFLELM